MDKQVSRADPRDRDEEKDAVKRPAIVPTEDLRRAVTGGASSSTSMHVSESPVQAKRGAEMTVQELEAKGAMDIEDLVDAPTGDSAAEQSNVAAACLDVCSLEVIQERALSDMKGEMFSCVAGFVRDAFAPKAINISQGEVINIATLCLELSAMDVAEAGDGLAC